MPSFSRRLFLASTLATLGAMPRRRKTTPHDRCASWCRSRPGCRRTRHHGRLVGQHLGANLGQQVVIDNRPGAGGIVGAEVVARGEPDGSPSIRSSTSCR
jgi:hypothetical protein